MKVCAILICTGLMGGPATAQAAPPDMTRIAFYATSENRSYGVLIAAPHNPSCPVQHYLIEGGRRPVVSRAVPQGGLRVVALGTGFARGAREETVTALGCAGPLTAARRVIFGAASPGHSWRAGESALTDVERDTLRQRQG